jgi:hypothetical protein
MHAQHHGITRTIGLCALPPLCGLNCQFFRRMREMKLRGIVVAVVLTVQPLTNL